MVYGLINVRLAFKPEVTLSQSAVPVTKRKSVSLCFICSLRDIGVTVMTFFIVIQAFMASFQLT